MVASVVARSAAEMSATGISIAAKFGYAGLGFAAGVLGAIGQASTDPIVERTAIGILAVLIVVIGPLVGKAVWENTKAVGANTTASQVAAEAFRALASQVQESIRADAAGRAVAVGVLEEKTDDRSSAIEQRVNERAASLEKCIDTAADRVISELHKTGGPKVA